MSGRQITDDLELLLGVMPPPLRQAIETVPAGEALVEIVLDLGRPPQARFDDRGVALSAAAVTRQDLASVVERVVDFANDNRASIERTLHPISAPRNRRPDHARLPSPL